MSELYWITRLDAVCGIIVIVLAFAFIALVTSIMVFMVWTDLRVRERARKLLSYSLITFLFSAFMYIFIPDTKQALIIYGVGGTIDYVKDNDKCKQIPNKVIDALDKYLEYLNKEDEK
jgi:hypothetical protein